MRTPRSRGHCPTHPWITVVLTLLLPSSGVAAESPPPPVSAPIHRTTSENSPNLPNVQRLTDEARQLRFAGAPGWRFSALRIIGQAVELHGGVPLDDLRQEAIQALATADLGAEPWSPKNLQRLFSINLAQDTFFGETQDGQVIERGLKDQQVVWQSSFESPATLQWLGQDWDHHRELWLRNGTHLESWDPSSRTIRSWASPGSKVRHAAFNWTGDRVALIQFDASSGKDQLWLAPVRSLDLQRRTKITASVTAAEWAPDNVRLAVLSDAPPQILIYETGSEVIAGTIPLSSRPLSVAWLPNARDVLVGTDSGLWFADTSTAEVHPFSGTTNVQAVALHASGTVALSSGRGGPVQLWDVAARQLLATFPKGGDHLGFSEDGASGIRRPSNKRNGLSAVGRQRTRRGPIRSGGSSRSISGESRWSSPDGPGRGAQYRKQRPGSIAHSRPARIRPAIHQWPLGSNSADRRTDPGLEPGTTPGEAGHPRHSVVIGKTGIARFG